MMNRTEEDVRKALALAKIDANDLMPGTQTVYFAEEGVHDNSFRLLELDSHLLACIGEGNALRIVGDDEEQAVLITDSRTYDLCETETSNSLLLAERLNFSKNLNGDSLRKVEIKGVFYKYLEATVSKPRLKKLTDLLEQSTYKGPEYEGDLNERRNLCTCEDLLYKIQASEQELKQALADLNAITIAGKIRRLDFEYHFRILSYMLKLLDENSWNLDEIDYDETLNSLTELAPRQVLEFLFDYYTEPSKILDGVQLYRYKETEICSFFAQVLLNEAGKFNLEEFLQAWQDSVPEGMKTDEEMLHGIALIDKNANPNVIWAFSEENLPENINERFQVLFKAKEKWTVREISPYIRRLATAKLDVNALLAKYARCSTINSVKYYSSKHGK